MNVLRVTFCVVIAVFALAQTCVAQSPLPPGPLEIHPLPGETETVRAGGPDGFFVSRDALRCDGPAEAIVGFRIRRGSVLDYLQIVCAQVQCANGRCGWTGYLSTHSVGDPNGGQFAALLLCEQNEVLSGYRARVKNIASINYVEDISVQCARIAAPPSGRNVVPVLQQDRHWIHATGHLGPAPFEGVCPATGATAVAAFGGRWITGPTVAQAMALLCGGGQSPCPSGTSSDFTDVFGPTGCKPCVILNGSANPVTGRTDREVANLPVDRYNCHFYILSYMNFVTPPIPGGGGRVPRPFDRLPGGQFATSEECLEDADFKNYGYSKVQADNVDARQLRLGDIVTVFTTSLFTQSCRNAHSGIVIQAGSNVRLRQKPNPVNCVTDFTWEEFLTFYKVDGRKNRANAWRR